MSAKETVDVAGQEPDPAAPAQANADMSQTEHPESSISGSRPLALGAADPNAHAEESAQLATSPPGSVIEPLGCNREPQETSLDGRDRHASSPPDGQAPKSVSIGSLGGSSSDPIGSIAQPSVEPGRSGLQAVQTCTGDEGMVGVAQSHESLGEAAATATCSHDKADEGAGNQSDKPAPSSPTTTSRAAQSTADLESVDHAMLDSNAPAQPEGSSSPGIDPPALDGGHNREAGEDYAPPTAASHENAGALEAKADGSLAQCTGKNEGLRGVDGDSAHTDDERAEAEVATAKAPILEEQALTPAAEEDVSKAEKGSEGPDAAAGSHVTEADPMKEEAEEESEMLQADATEKSVVEVKQVKEETAQEREARMKAEAEKAEAEYEEQLGLLRSNWKFASCMQFLRVFTEPLRLKRATLSSDLLEAAIMRPWDSRQLLGELLYKLLRPNPEVHYSEKDSDKWEAMLEAAMQLKWEQHFDENPLHEKSFFALKPSERMHILYLLCDWKLQDDLYLKQSVKLAVDNPDIGADKLRHEPFGCDSKGNEYFYFAMGGEDCRMYQQEPNHYFVPKPRKLRSARKTTRGSRKKKQPEEEEWERIEVEDPQWSTTCTTLEEMQEWAEGLGKSRSAADKALYKHVTTEILPKLVETANARKRALEKQILYESLPKKRSSRISEAAKMKEEEAKQAAIRAQEEKERRAAEAARRKEQQRLLEMRRQEAAREERSRQRAELAERRRKEWLQMMGKPSGNSSTGLSREERLALRLSRSEHGPAADGNGDESSRAKRTRSITRRMVAGLFEHRATTRSDSIRRTASIAALTKIVVDTRRARGWEPARKPPQPKKRAKQPQQAELPQDAREWLERLQMLERNGPAAAMTPEAAAAERMLGVFGSSNSAGAAGPGQFGPGREASNPMLAMRAASLASMGQGTGDNLSANTPEAQLFMQQRQQQLQLLQQRQQQLLQQHGVQPDKISGQQQVLPSPQQQRQLTAKEQADLQVLLKGMAPEQARQLAAMTPAQQADIMQQARRQNQLRMLQLQKQQQQVSGQAISGISMPVTSTSQLGYGNTIATTPQLQQQQQGLHHAQAQPTAVQVQQEQILQERQRQLLAHQKQQIAKQQLLLARQQQMQQLASTGSQGLLGSTIPTPGASQTDGTMGSVSTIIPNPSSGSAMQPLSLIHQQQLAAPAQGPSHSTSQAASASETVLVTSGGLQATAALEKTIKAKIKAGEQVTDDEQEVLKLRDTERKAANARRAQKRRAEKKAAAEAEKRQKTDMPSQDVPNLPTSMLQQQPDLLAQKEQLLRQQILAKEQQQQQQLTSQHFGGNMATALGPAQGSLGMMPVSNSKQDPAASAIRPQALLKQQQQLTPQQQADLQVLLKGMAPDQAKQLAAMTPAQQAEIMEQARRQNQRKMLERQQAAGQAMQGGNMLLAPGYAEMSNATTTTLLQPQQQQGQTLTPNLQQMQILQQQRQQQSLVQQNEQRETGQQQLLLAQQQQAAKQQLLVAQRQGMATPQVHQQTLHMPIGQKQNQGANIGTHIPNQTHVLQMQSEHQQKQFGVEPPEPKQSAHALPETQQSVPSIETPQDTQP